jgi:phospholipase C
VPSQRGGTVKLESGKLLNYHGYSWKSTNDFTLTMSLELQFQGLHGSWNEGENDRFVTFTRSANGQPFLMEFNTGP